jgi:hypothetical protein
VAVFLDPLVRLHTEASALSGNLGGPRPVEPLLVFAGDIEAACPPTLLPLLKKVLALRAIRTACMLGYWGQWQRGRQLLRQFCPRSQAPLPRWLLAQACASPMGGLLGKTWRLMSSQRWIP